MNSLKKLIQLQAGIIYPAHGPVLQNATEILEKYVSHRTMRENQVIIPLFLKKQLNKPCLKREMVQYHM